MSEVKSRSTVKLNPNQSFAYDYGEYSEGIPYVARDGGLKPIWSAPLYGGIFLVIVALVCYLGSMSLGNSMLASIIKGLAFFLIALAVAAFITYITIYLSKYLPNFRNWYASLPEDAISRVPGMNS